MARQDAGERSDRSRGGRSGAGRSDTPEVPFRGFINLNLSQEDKAGLQHWVEEGGADRRLELEAAGGVSFGLREDTNGNGFLASGTQRRPGSPNAGLCVTARGRTPGVAWLRLLYVLELLARAPSWEATQPLADPDRW